MQYNQQRKKEVKKEDFPLECYISKTEFGLVAPLWDIHDRMDFEQCIGQFDQDFNTAARDIGAHPVTNYSAYFQNPMMIDSCVNRFREHPMDLDNRFKPWFRGKNFNYYLGLDIGLTGDWLGLALGHKEGEKLIFDLLYSIDPADRGGEIQFSEILSFISDLKNRAFHLKMISTDSFQSKNFQQQISFLGFEIEQNSVDRTTEAYDLLKSFIIEGNCDFYYNPVAISELKNLVVANGKVDHLSSACFVGETEVSCSDGVSRTFDSLVADSAIGIEHYGFSWDGEKEIVKKLQHPRITKHVKDLVDVVLDNGEVFRCTPDHKFLLVSGIYKEAKDLTPFDELKN